MSNFRNWKKSTKVSYLYILIHWRSVPWERAACARYIVVMNPKLWRNTLQKTAGYATKRKYTTKHPENLRKSAEHIIPDKIIITAIWQRAKTQLRPNPTSYLPNNHKSASKLQKCHLFDCDGEAAPSLAVIKIFEQHNTETYSEDRREVFQIMRSPMTNIKRTKGKTERKHRNTLHVLVFRRHVSHGT